MLRKPIMQPVVTITTWAALAAGIAAKVKAPAQIKPVSNVTSSSRCGADVGSNHSTGTKAHTKARTDAYKVA